MPPAGPQNNVMAMRDGGLKEQKLATVALNKYTCTLRFLSPCAERCAPCAHDASVDKRGSRAGAVGRGSLEK